MAKKKVIKPMALDEALALPNDNDRFDAIRERIAAKLTTACAYEKLRHGEKLVWQINWLLWEADNGGFEQYLANSAGDYAQVTIGFLEDIRAKSTCKVLKKIAKIFPADIIPSDQNARGELLSAWEQKNQAKAEAFFTEMNEAFYERDENLAELAVAYVRKHPEEFT